MGHGHRNTGSLPDPGCVGRSVYKAVTRQSGNFFRNERGMVLMLDLDWRVLDHFISSVAPSGEKNISPLASCLVGSNVPTVWGKRSRGLTTEFDILVDWKRPLLMQLGMSREGYLYRYGL